MAEAVGPAQTGKGWGVNRQTGFQVTVNDLWYWARPSDQVYLVSKRFVVNLTTKTF